MVFESGKHGFNQAIGKGFRICSFAPSGLGPLPANTHGLRRGLHSYAALRLNSSELKPRKVPSAQADSGLFGYAFPALTCRAI